MTLDRAVIEAERRRRIAARAEAKQERNLALMTHAARVYDASAGASASFRNAPKRGAMNKTEARYADHLRLQVAANRIVDWKYGALSLRLAPRTWYRPDFLVWVLPSGIVEIHEVKGHWEDDARAKFKIAAELYPMFVFRAVRRVRGEFHIIETLND